MEKTVWKYGVVPESESNQSERIGMRPWAGGPSDILYGEMRAKPLSKLDAARLQLSKLKLKYTKQEKQSHEDPPSSSTDLSSSETSRTDVKIPKMLSREPTENLNRDAGDLEVIDHDSEGFESDSLKSAPSQKHYFEYSPKVGLSDEELIKSPSGSSPSDSFTSKIHEKIHSLSVLELLSSVQELKSVSDNIVAPDITLERDMDETSVSTIADTPQSESRAASLEPLSPVQQRTILSKSLSHDIMVNNVAPSILLERDTDETSVSTIADTSQSESRVPPTELSQMAPVRRIQETSNSTSSGAEIGITLQSRYSSTERDSSVTLVSLRKEPKVRSVKIQTERKRSRTVQVSLSEHSYEERRRPCYPVLRASSLPRGLRTQDETVESLGYDMDDTMQLLLRSQLMLTLNLLRREQALYFNCSRSAARMEKGYKRHTLSDTRQFIRQEKELRNKLRGNAMKEDIDNDNDNK